MNRYVFAATLVVVGVSGLNVSCRAQDSRPPELRVMSFNIRYGTAKDGDDIWANRQDLVVKVIKSFAPDLMGTQETLPFQASYINEQFPEYTYIGRSRDENKDGEQCGIFLRKERFTVLASGQFWLSETPDKEFSKSWDSSLPRVATWTRLRDKLSDDREFMFANTHFDHRGAEARKQSALLLRHQLSEMAPNLPIIVTGDFNCGQGSEPYQQLTKENVLLDSYRMLHPTPKDGEGTFHGFRGTPGVDRIDWILATKHFNVTAASIDSTHADSRYPSDHFPVSAVYMWQK